MNEEITAAIVEAVKRDREATGGPIVQRVRAIEAAFMKEFPGYSYNSQTLALLTELREFAQFLRLNADVSTEARR